MSMETIFSPEQHPHRRYNPLTSEWILVSPHRNLRPWQGQQEKPVALNQSAFDPQCYLCPGNHRAGGQVNPKYTDTLVFTNDFAALLPDKLETADSESELFRNQSVMGTCRVVCFSPRHDLTLPQMPVEQIQRVIDTWAEQTIELGARHRWVQIFENKGAIMGCSNPHPHGQIWAGDFLPRIPEMEDSRQAEYFRQHQRPLLCDYVDQELKREVRIIECNPDWVMLVPYWATWPFELLLLPRRPVLRLPDLTPAERANLADILRRSLLRYDGLFDTSFPYSMGWHGAPNGEGSFDHWQLHAHFYPPLLRSATIKKFMVGYELLAESQRDLTPEQAAMILRKVPVSL
jgi:UDPglucose--hexose-1-phosphate uridylyltransferase